MGDHRTRSVWRSGSAARRVDQWRRSMPAEVWTLGLLSVVGGISCVLGAVFPISQNGPVALDRVIAGTAFMLAIALLAGGAKVSRRALHACVVVKTLCASLLISQCVTSGGLMMTAIVYQWIAVYVALFFSVRAIRLHGLLITVSFGVAVAIADLPGTMVEWVIMSFTVWAAALALGTLSERLRTQADTDHLTGLLNRSGLEKAAAREMAIAGRTGNPLTVAVIDLDDFKEVNDVQGHVAGDVLLADLARTWQAALRPGDLLVRFGGDEFLLMLPATSTAEAEAAIGRLRDAHPAGWSVGVATWQRGEPLADCVARADARLYDAKAARGDGFTVASNVAVAG